VRPILTASDRGRNRSGDLDIGRHVIRHGAAGFISTVRSIDVIREVHDKQGSAIVYDAE